MARKRLSEVAFRLTLYGIASATARRREALEKKNASCGNCGYFKAGRCSLKKNKLVKPYNICEYWKEVSCAA